MTDLDLCVDNLSTRYRLGAGATLRSRGFTPP